MGELRVYANFSLCYLYLCGQELFFSGQVWIDLICIDL